MINQEDKRDHRYSKNDGQYRKNQKYDYYDNYEEGNNGRKVIDQNRGGG